MRAEKPAEGILKRNDFGNSMYYQIVCGCGQDVHDHNVEVEANETGVNVNIYVTVKSDYWTETVEKRYNIDNPWQQEFDWFWKDLINGLVRRVKATWEIWTTGAITSQTTIAMSKQQSLNYAETLKSAIKDVEQFEAERKVNHEIQQAVKQAEQGDCV